jgi:DNA-binding response OmpR family regulator
MTSVSPSSNRPGDLPAEERTQHEQPGPPVVLIVEDDERIAMFMIKGLRASGFTPEWVTTGTEALERLETGDIAVQVLDLGLPDMDGLDLLRQLNQRGDPTPTVIVTARTDPKDRKSGLDLGASVYITKPFPFADLVAAVRSCASDGAGRSLPSTGGSAGHP